MQRIISNFAQKNFKHFNAASLLDSAMSYKTFVESNGYMLLSMAGALSTAEIGISLAEMIGKGKVHCVCCTGANLEEDVLNLLGNKEYIRLPKYRYFDANDELQLYEKGLCRVTDVGIPDSKFQFLENSVLSLWSDVERRGERLFPHEVVFRLLQDKQIEKMFQIPQTDSWVIAAMERNIPIFVPGWEDSSLGNSFAFNIRKGTLTNPNIVKSGIEYMVSLCDWYQKESQNHEMGFFQIGGGIPGDFSICVVPTLNYEEDLVPLWNYFCQISDSVTSYGSYSGAVPNEKITWGKLSANTPTFVIESDATIVVPIIFAMVLGM